MKNRKKIELKRWQFEEFIEFCFDEHLKEDDFGFVDFNPMKIPNRNSLQVPNGLWRRLIDKHFKRYHNN